MNRKAGVGLLAVVLAATLLAGPGYSQGQGGPAVRMAIQTDVTFNPLYARGSDAVFVTRVVFAQLTRVDDRYVAVPELATSWESTQGGTVWNFKLNPRARWHDSRPVTADDVKFTFDAILDPRNRSFQVANIRDLDRVEVIDPLTVRFILKESNAWWPEVLSYGFGIIPRHLLGSVDIARATEFNTRTPVGAGPYRVKEVVQGSHVVLEAFDQYFLGRPKISTVIYKVIPDINVQVAQLRSGELDLATIESQHIAAMRADPRLVVDVLPVATTLMLNWNHTVPVLQDKRVRQALVYALDRKTIIQRVTQGTAIFGNSPIIPAIKEYWWPDEVKSYPYDPNKALELLREAGWTRVGGSLQKDGRPLSLSILVDRGNQTREQVGVIVKQYYEDLGMRINLEVLERSVWSNRLTAGQFEGYISNRSFQAIPDNMRIFWMTDSSTNLGKFSNSKIDGLLLAGKREFKQDLRRRIYWEFQKIFVDEAPLVMIFYDPEVEARDRGLQGKPRVFIRESVGWIEQWQLRR
ncbi:MAG: ABC transporter substrate-binding protein [Armatimonadota bacterium]